MISFTTHGRRDRHSLLVLLYKVWKRLSGLRRNWRPSIGRSQVVMGDDEGEEELGGVLAGEPLEVLYEDVRDERKYVRL